MQTLEHLGSRLDNDWVNLGFSLSAGEIPYDGWDNDKVPLPFDRNTWDSLVLLFRRSWFGRLWVWQEIRLANERAIVYCGRRSMLWQHLRVSRTFLHTRTQPLGSRQFLDNRALLLCMYDRSKYSLGNILEGSRGYECSDDKDKIYALLGICQVQLNIKPDYRKSTAQVYEEAFMACFVRTRTLDLLRYCQFDKDSHGMPSWVPNWALRKPVKRIPQYFRACGWSRAYADSEPNGVLTVQGIRAGVVRDSEILKPRSPMREDWVVLIRRIAKQQADSTSSKTSRKEIDDVCATLCCNTFSDIFQPPISAFPDLESSKHFLNCVVESEADPEPSSELPVEVQRYISEVARITNHRSLITTEDNRIGIAPEETSAGDEIVVILGCVSPIVLRPTAQGYLVVGDCYLHGSMQAESLLGPLPHPWKCVNRYHEALREYFTCFFNKETNQYQLDDPRLGPLSDGWHVKSHSEESGWNWYVNENTGEDAGEFDPRLTPEALKQRGVNLQKFRLI